jgi:hypothetical protein
MLLSSQNLEVTDCNGEAGSPVQNATALRSGSGDWLLDQEQTPFLGHAF